MRHPFVLPFLAGSVVFLVACTRTSAQMAPPDEAEAKKEIVSLAAGHDDAVKRDRERVRAATAAFKDLAAAQAVGYPTVTPKCIENPGVGGMGHHYVNRSFLDDKVDVERPEILVYAPTGGKPKLAGVEYIIPYSAWDREKDAPEIFGQKLKRSDELSIWYLHVWAWEKNEAGLFADWNPAVHCSH